MVKALLAKADLVTDNEDKVALYDRVITECGGAMGIYLSENIWQAVKAKAELLDDKLMVEHFEDSRIRMYPDSAEAAGILAERAHKITDPSARALASDQLVERFSGSSDPVVVSRISDLLFERAENTGNNSGKLAIYDQIISFGINAGNMTIHDPIESALQKRLRLTKSAGEKLIVYDKVVSALKMAMPTERVGLLAEVILAKADLVSNKAEKIRLCDEAISRVENDSGFYDLNSIVTNALRVKAEAMDDEGLEAQYYDHIIDEGDDLNKLMWALSGRLDLAANREDKIRVYDRAIDVVKTSYFSEEYIFRFLMAKTKIIDDQMAKMRILDEALLFCPGEVEEIALLRAKGKFSGSKQDRLAIYRTAFDKFGGKRHFSQGEWPRSSFMDNGYAPMIELIKDWAAALDDDSAKAEMYRLVLDKCKSHFEYATRKNLKEMAEAIIKLTGDRAGMLEYYDQRIKLAENDVDATDGFLDKADLADSPALVEAILDELLARYRYSEDYQAQFGVTRALERKLTLTNDLAKMAEIYAELARQLGARGSGSFHRNAMKALLDRASVTIDKSSAIALYDEVISEYERTGNAHFWDSYVEAMGRKAELIDDAVAKIKLYDAILDTSSGKSPPLNRGLAYPIMEEPRHLFPKYMMKKAALISGRAEKVRIYEQIIDSYGSSSASAAVEAYNAMIELADDPSEKVALCDQLIAFLNNSASNSKSSYSPVVAKTLYRKGKITGNMSLLAEYYAGAIAEAANEIDKERLAFLEICDIGGSDEKIAVCEKLIGKYRNSVNHKELDLLSRAYTTKAEIEGETDTVAASMTYDESIRVFTSKKPPTSAYDDRYTVINAIAKAYDGKVKLATSFDEKIRLYDESIAVCRRYDLITETSINCILENKVKVLRGQKDATP